MMSVRAGLAGVLAAMLSLAATLISVSVFAAAPSTPAATSVPVVTPTPTATTATATTPTAATAAPSAEDAGKQSADVNNQSAAPVNSGAVNPVTNLAKPVATAPVVTSSPLSLASGLIFLLALVLIAAWLVKRSGGMPAWRSGSAMKVVAALSVGPRERVLLIEMGGQQWLLGVTPSAINNLHHFAQPIITAGSADEFSNKLRQLLPQGFGK